VWSGWRLVVCRVVTIFSLAPPPPACVCIACANTRCTPPPHTHQHTTEHANAVVVKGGKVIQVLDGVPSKPRYPVLDYGTAVISPGVIDVHVHMNEPGREHWEGAFGVCACVSWCVCACVRACVRAFVRWFVRLSVRVCVCQPQQRRLMLGGLPAVRCISARSTLAVCGTCVAAYTTHLRQHVMQA
jgi:hypothetical protein